MAVQFQKSEVYAYPSHFGSHSKMIDKEETEKLKDKNLVVIKDEHGKYITEKWKLDNGLADQNRFAGSRLKFFNDEGE